MQIKFINQFDPSIRYRLPLKQRLWFLLPSRVRLRIEYRSWLGSVIVNQLKQTKQSKITALRVRYNQKLARLLPAIKQLNNPYLSFMQSRAFEKSRQDYKPSEAMQKFLLRMQNTPNHFSK